jgi:hypothetical protein
MYPSSSRNKKARKKIPEYYVRITSLRLWLRGSACLRGNVSHNLPSLSPIE